MTYYTHFTVEFTKPVPHTLIRRVTEKAGIEVHEPKPLHGFPTTIIVESSPTTPEEITSFFESDELMRQYLQSVTPLT